MKINGATWLGAFLTWGMGFSVAINYTNHAAILPILMRTLAIGPGSAGLLTTALFAFNALVTIPAGALSDRFDARPVVATGLVLCVGANVGIYLHPAFATVLLSKAMVGVGSGLCFIGGTRYLEAIAPPGQAQFLLGMFGGFFQLGAGAGLMGTPLLLRWLDWRQSFLVAAAAALLLFLLWWLAPPGRRLVRAPGNMLQHLKSRNAWLLALVHADGFGMALVLGTWLSTLLLRRHGLSLQMAGLLASITLVGGILLRPLGGWLMSSGAMRSRRLLQLATAVTTIGLGVLVPERVPLGLVAVGLVVIAVGVNLSYAAIFISASATHPDGPGAVQGMISTLATGFVLVSAPATGWLAGRTGGFSWPVAFLSLFSLLAFAGAGFVRGDRNTGAAVPRRVLRPHRT